MFHPTEGAGPALFAESSRTLLRTHPTARAIPCRDTPLPRGATSPCSRAPRLRGWSDGLWSSDTLSHLHECKTTLAVKSPSASLLIDIGTPNVSSSSRSFRATATLSVDSNGHASRNVLALSTITNKCLIPALETCFMFWRSPSSTYHGHNSRAGIITTR